MSVRQQPFIFNYNQYKNGELVIFKNTAVACQSYAVITKEHLTT